jgi:hypothetical protein
MKQLLAVLLLTTAPSLRAQPKPAADPATLLTCLLSGWPHAEECHAQLIAAGPKTIAAVRPGLEQALKADPGLPVRDHNNAVAITATPASRQPAHPDTPRLAKAQAAAEELGRLGEWKKLVNLGTVTAAEGLGHMQSPPRIVLTTLARWASDPTQMRRRLAAAYSLKHYGPKAAPIVPQLIKMLDQDQARLYAFETLEAIGPGAAAAVSKLAPYLKEKSGWSDSARSTLAAINTPEAKKLLEDNPAWTVAP